MVTTQSSTQTTSPTTTTPTTSPTSTTPTTTPTTTTTRQRPAAVAPDRAAVFASADGDLELVAAEGRSVYIAGRLECAEIAALNGTAARLGSVLSALEARVSTLEAGGGP